MFHSLVCRLAPAMLVSIFFVGIAGSAQAQLVGHWRLDESAGSTTLIDASPQGNDATAGAGTTLGVPGVAGTAAFVDAAGPGIDANMGTDWVTGDLARTITAWFNVSDFGGGQDGIFGNGHNSGNLTRFDINAEAPGGLNSVMFRYQGGNFAWSGTAEFGDELQEDTWYHLAITVPDGATPADVDAYINGTLLTADGGNGNNSTLQLATAGNFEIGQTAGALDGFVDDVQYYNTELTAAEIDLLFNNPGLSLDEINSAAVPEPGTLAIWALIGAGFGLYGYRRRRVMRRSS